MKREQETPNQAEFVYGHYASVAALKGTQEINKVWLQTGLQDKIRNEVTQLAKKRGLVIQQAPKSKLDELTDGGNHQGVVLSVAAFTYATIDDLFARAEERQEAPFFLILDGIEDP
ncbi:MAG: RNA methyltransferase substrate-binding domain-containing protein, partial [Leuconostoc lactis]